MKRVKRILCTVIAFTLIATSGAFACTGAYVGKDVSANGTTILARSEDQGGGAYNKMFKVQERSKEAGRYFVDTGEGQNNFKVPLPKTTYKYTYVPDSSDHGDGMYPACCNNEYGVSIVGTISADAGEKFSKVDPMVERGLREAILPGLIACQVKTSKEAVDLMAKLVDKYGSQEGNILFFADQKEAWIFEAYGGYSYCAMKMPTDKVAVFGNEFMIGRVDKNDKKNYVFSKNLFKNLDKAGAVIEDGQYNIAKTVEGKREEYSNMRTWEGARLLAPSKTGEYKNDYFYPLFFSPDKKVTLQQIFDLYRSRYENTPYDMMKAGNEKRRPIGVTRSSDVHVVEIFDDLPKDTCCLQWLCLGNAEHSVFIPSFSGITNTPEQYKVDGAAYNRNSAYWMFKQNETLAEGDRAMLGQGVKDYWKLQEGIEQDEINGQIAKVKAAYKKSERKGRKYVTKLADEMAKKQFKNAKTLFNDLMYTATNNIDDRDTAERRTTYVGPIDLETGAAYRGYNVERQENTNDDAVKFVLTKKDKKVELTMGQDKYTVKVGKKKAEEKTLAFAPYEKGKSVYVPVNFINSL